MNETVIHIINEYESLRKALKHIILNNRSNTVPYHNLNHLLTVTQHCHNALFYEAKVTRFGEEHLLMAALFHDFNHSAGQETDAVNVSWAKDKLQIFCENEDIPLDVDFMHSIIDATQYPYVIPAEELTIYQKIIRDADLCQIYEYNWLQQNIFGLAQEMNLSVTSLIAGQRKFLENIEPLTTYGKHMHKNYFPHVMKELEILEDIMK